jgi:hypothetical protein
MKNKDLNNINLSISKIKSYQNCQYKYYLQYIKKQKIESNFNPKYFKIGQFAHKYIESRIKQKELKFNSTTLSREDKKNIIAKYENIFHNYYLKDILIDCEVEVPFSLFIDENEIDGFRVQKKFIRKANFNGYIDLVNIQDKVANIIDWKTGLNKSSDFTQLLLYAKAINKLYNVNRFNLFYYYIDLNELDLKQVGITEVNNTMIELIDIGLEIQQKENEKEFKKNKEYCKFCPFNKLDKYNKVE